MKWLQNFLKNPKVIKSFKVIRILFYISLVVFVIQSLIFQAKTNERFYDLGDAWVTKVENMLDPKFHVMNDFSMMVKQISTVNGDTVIDALVLNRTGIGLSDFELFVTVHQLTEKGKKAVDIKNISDFYDNRLSKFSNFDMIYINNIIINSGSARKIRFVVKDTILTNDMLIKLTLSASKVHYK